MTPRFSASLDAAIEDTLAFTRRRADKHADDPLTDVQWGRVAVAFEDELRSALARWFVLDTDGDEE